MVIGTSTCDTCISNEVSKDIIMAMYLCINGLIEKSQVIAGLTTISLNMGVVRFEGNRAMIHYALRSPLLSVRTEMVNQLESVANIFNGYVEVFSDYPGWDYDASSALRKQLKEFYFNRTGVEMKEYATHGGLETGVFKGKLPELDIVTFGPNMSDIHTPDERLDIKSYLSTYDFLIDFLETL
jgi:dipeptidase D